MACRSCDLKRIYRLFEEKKRREAKEAEEKARFEAEETAKRVLKKKTYVPAEAVVEPVIETVEEVKTEEPVVKESEPEDDFGLI